MSRNTLPITNQHHHSRCKVSNRASTASTKTANEKTSREKPQRFDEQVPYPCTSRGPSLDFVPDCHFSEFWGLPPDTGSHLTETNMACLLPRPMGSPEGLMCFNQRTTRLSPESLSFGLSCGPSFSSDGDDLQFLDHGGFASFRTSEEASCSLGLRNICAASRTSIPGAATSYCPASSGPCFDSLQTNHEFGSQFYHPLSRNLPMGNSHSFETKWKRGRLLGRGSFGSVYAGFNSENGHMCAIKEVQVISDDRNSQECLKQLNQGGNKLSVYLEYVSGGSVSTLLREYGPFKEPLIRSYTRQLLLGLAYLHRKDTVHRDIKGSNILVDPNGQIKLADFGMAKHITSYFSLLSFRGSPYWMAPEVIMNGNGCSLAADIWSLGCTVIEMAASKPPWFQYEGVAAMFKIANSRTFPQIPDSLSRNAQNFVKHCLQRDPAARPTAAQLLNHPFVLDQVISGQAQVDLVDGGFPSPFHGAQSAIYA